MSNAPAAGASDGVMNRIMNMKQAGEEWKSRRRHSQVANGAAQAGKAAPEVIDAPLKARIEAMQTAAEEWKFKERHSKRGDTVLSPDQVDVQQSTTPGGNRIARTIRRSSDGPRADALPSEATLGQDAATAPGGRAVELRTTKAGHVVRATVRNHVTKSISPSPVSETGDSSVIGLQTELGNVSVGQDGSRLDSPASKVNPTRVTKRISPSKKTSELEATIYSDMVFPTSPKDAGDVIFGATKSEDSVVYMDSSQLAFQNSGSPGRSPDNRHPEAPPGSSDDSDLDEQTEAAMLYDNSDYVGTKGFEAKRTRVVRKKTARAGTQSTNDAPQNGSADSGTHADSDGVSLTTYDQPGVDVHSGGENSAAAGGDDDEDEDIDSEEEAKMLYDNDQYTGRHPDLHKRNNVRRKKKGNP